MTTGKKVKFGILLGFLLLLGIIIFQNTERITTNILFAKVEMPQAFLLFLIFIFGAMFGFITAYVRVNKSMAKNMNAIAKK